MAMNARKKRLLNKMNMASQLAGLGDIIGLASPVASGVYTTAGGDATESITVSDCASGDIAIVTVKTAGATPRSVVAAAAGSAAITVTMSDDPSTDHVLQYVVLRVV